MMLFECVVVTCVMGVYVCRKDKNHRCLSSGDGWCIMNKTVATMYEVHLSIDISLQSIGRYHHNSPPVIIYSNLIGNEEVVMTDGWIKHSHYSDILSTTIISTIYYYYYYHCLLLFLLLLPLWLQLRGHLYKMPLLLMLYQLI